MHCGCILHGYGEENFVTVRPIDLMTQVNEKFRQVYMCNKHKVDISILAQWTIFMDDVMDFGTFIINVYIGYCHINNKHLKHIAESLKFNNFIHSINLGNL